MAEKRLMRASDISREAFIVFASYVHVNNGVKVSDLNLVPIVEGERISVLKLCDDKEGSSCYVSLR
jgi:hypothetical protein